MKESKKKFLSLRNAFMPANNNFSPHLRNYQREISKLELSKLLLPPPPLLQDGDGACVGVGKEIYQLIILYVREVG